MSELDLSSRDITSLKGLEAAANLSVLNLAGNSIEDITPLAGMAKLTYLILGDETSSGTGRGNRISDLSPLAGLSGVVTLWLDRNSIVDITALSGLTELNEVWLFDNMISDIRPLVDNAGLGSGDRVRLENNPLDAGDCPDILALIERGVTVEHTVQGCPP